MIATTGDPNQARLSPTFETDSTPFLALVSAQDGGVVWSRRFADGDALSSLVPSPQGTAAALRSWKAGQLTHVSLMEISPDGGTLHDLEFSSGVLLGFDAAGTLWGDTVRAPLFVPERISWRDPSQPVQLRRVDVYEHLTGWVQQPDGGGIELEGRSLGVALQWSIAVQGARCEVHQCSAIRPRALSGAETVVAFRDFDVDAGLDFGCGRSQSGVVLLSSTGSCRWMRPSLGLDAVPSGEEILIQSPMGGTLVRRDGGVEASFAPASLFFSSRYSAAVFTVDQTATAFVIRRVR